MANFSHPDCTAAAPQSLFMAGLQRLTRRLERQRPRLDSQDLPDDMKRDLGLLDGRPAPRRDLLRD